MDLSEDLIVPYKEHIVRSARKRVYTRGYVDLRTCLGIKEGEGVEGEISTCRS